MSSTQKVLKAKKKKVEKTSLGKKLEAKNPYKVMTFDGSFNSVKSNIFCGNLPRVE